MTGPRRIVVLEYFTATPPAGGDAPAAEGRAMRDAVVADLAALPGVEVVVLHAPGWPPPRTRSRARVVRGEPGRALRAALPAADAALVIAPEEDGILERLSAIVEESGRRLLGPSSRAVRLAADKAATVACLAAAGLPTPASEAISFERAAVHLARRPLPLVLKPRDGCGGAGVVVVRRRDRAAAAIALVRAATRRNDLLVQDHVAGDAASVSLVVADGGGVTLPLALNRQAIRGASRLAYAGGMTPWRHPQARRAIAIAVEAVAVLGSAAPGWRGHVGIDLVFGTDGPRIIEINPRLTTSYIGIRRVARRNLAGLILDAAIGRPLPAALPLAGTAEFTPDGAVRVAPRSARLSGARGRPSASTRRRGVAA